jgi:23S rRNA pseudouridine1911/1915/1917 synthase
MSESELPSVAQRILFEDNHILIVNKLPSEIVQGDKTGDVSLLDDVKEYIRITYNKPGNVFAGLVHRIDRPVSGAVVFAKTSKALSRLTVMIKERDFAKNYLAIVKNRPKNESGTLEHYLVKNETKNKSFVVSSSSPGAKLAKLNYRLLASSDNFHLIEVELLTGRHHQIRAQLSAIGCPIKGDLKYGYDRSNTDGSICLHAWKVSFVHPVKDEPVEVSAPLPKGIPWQFFENIIQSD